MLSGISHDLRTPLTRMKLQLAFIKDENISKKLSTDIDEMEKMLNEYLQFSKLGSVEKTETFDISDLIESTVKKYNNNIKTKLKERTYINARKNLIQRCLNNLIDNSIKYAKNINIQLEKINTNIILTIDDDGIGIPKNEYDNVFKPFYKIDKSRSETKSSVGLGLSITSDIVKSHGGTISLGQSEEKGLRVKIIFPI
jgi:two-component system osmolarity sensor histidine kinase EnvZ